MRIWNFLCLSLCLLFALAASSTAQDTNFPVGPQYLITSGSPLFLQSIATPSLSFGSGQTQPQVSEVSAEPTPAADEKTYEEVASILDEQRRTELLRIYYGLPQLSVVEIALGEPAEVGTEFSIPASISESGVVQFTDAQGLRERGYGVALAEAAARVRNHEASPRHVYTNEDVERLRSRN